MDRIGAGILGTGILGTGILGTCIPSADEDSAYASRTPTKTTTPRESSAEQQFVTISDDHNPSGDESAHPVKRRRIDIQKDVQEHVAASPEPRRPTYKRSSFEVTIDPPPLVHPKSQYKGWQHGMERESEMAVLSQFLERNPTPDEEGSIFFRLEEFTVYQTDEHKRRPLEMVALSALNVHRAVGVFLVDGILTDGITRHRVEGLLTDQLSIGYLDKDGTMLSKTEVWIQSVQNSSEGNNIWYSIGSPAPEYARYHQPFLWLTAFAKYFVLFADMLVEDRDEDISLWNFKSQFAEWLKVSQGDACKPWLAQYNGDDFRVAVSCHREWLWKEVHGVSEVGSRVRKISLWKDVLHLTAIQPARGALIDRTVVTPYVYECFEELFTTKLLKVQPKELEVTSPMKLDAVVIPVKPKRWIERDENGALLPFSYDNPKVGDVIVFERDEGTSWQANAQDDGLWFGYVTKVMNEKVNLVWLYKPTDTILFSPSSKYPHANELFFSDHCNCNEAGKIPAFTKDVVAVANVNFFGQPGQTKGQYFIRAKYETELAGFVTLKEQDLKVCPCVHKRDEGAFTAVRTKYKLGDTVLYKMVDVRMLQAGAVHGFDDDKGKLVLRRLDLRRGLENTPQREESPPNEFPVNELVWTDSFVTVNPKAIIRHNTIRIFLEGEGVVSPYNRNGKGDCFFIRVGEDGKAFQQLPARGNFRQGFLVGHGAGAHRADGERASLKGLDLFCGGGNFGRGLEEGGAVEMKWAVDIESAPLHSYRANLRDPADANMYLGSINNYLKDAITGKYSDVIASPDEVDFISAGSPCQGFSLANGNRDSERSLQNCSLVSSLATAIDIYRPKYALLENVHQLAQTRKRHNKPDYNVFSTLLCCIVGMGYQCQQFILDSWSYGDPQSRTRLFLAVSAPGLNPLRRPPRTHEHPPTVRNLSLYKAPNGEGFADRDFSDSSPFRSISSFQAMSHLPNIFDDHVGLCTRYPDHQTSRDEADKTRRLLLYIPRFPYEQGWTNGVRRGMLTENLRVYDFEGERTTKQSKSWKRIRRNGLCRTITTTITAQCNRTGQYVHYDQPRLITVQEARIAQGFPDDEVLVGDKGKRFKIVGNSVARGVSMAMGLALRRAHFEEWED